MKLILTLLVCIISISLNAQQGYYELKANRILSLKTLRPSRDTLTQLPADSGSIAYKNGRLYTWTGTLWTQAGWQLGGNSVTQDSSIGTNSNFGLLFKTNGIKRGRITNSGQFIWGADSDPLGFGVYINDTLRVRSIKILNGSAATETARNAALSIKTFNALSTDYAINVESTPGGVVLFRLTNAGGVSLPAIATLWNSTEYRATGTTLFLRVNNLTSTSNGLVRLGAMVGHQPGIGQHTSIVSIEGPGMEALSGSGVSSGLRVRPIITAGAAATGTVFGILYEPDVISLGTTQPHISYGSKSGKTQFRGTSHDETNVVTLTNNTTTTIATIPLATTEAEFEMMVTIFAEGTSTLKAFYRRLLRVKNSSGVLTILGSYQAIGTDYEEAGMTTCDVSATVSGTNVLLQATSLSATNVDWKAIWETRNFGITL